MGSSVVEDVARMRGRSCVAVPPDPETILRAAAELLDPVLQPLGFQRGAPGHWTSTRFAWHEDVLVEVDALTGGLGPAWLTVEVFAGVPRRGIGDPVPGTPFVRALEPWARELVRQLVGSGICSQPDPASDPQGDEGRLRIRDEADLRMWLAFIVEHLPAAIARVRGHGWRHS